MGTGPGARSVEVRKRLTRKAGRALIRPKGYTDIDVRVVVVREIIRHNIFSPSAPDIEWELATVQAMARGQQRSRTWATPPTRWWSHQF